MKMRIALLLFVTVLAGVFAWMTLHSPPRSADQAVLKRILGAAKSSYERGRYDDCVMQLETLHGKTAEFADSRQLESLCREELQSRPRLPAPEDGKRSGAEEIEDVVRECKKSLGPHPTLRETQDCLAPAIEIDPRDKRVVEMLRGANPDKK